jgi:hypothetical protein
MVSPVLASPLGTYDDVLGVVDATAAAEIVVLLDTLLGYIPITTHAEAQANPPAGEPPEFDKWHPVVAELIRGEITALAAAIAAAPTS